MPLVLDMYGGVVESGVGSVTRCIKSQEKQVQGASSGTFCHKRTMVHSFPVWILVSDDRALSKHVLKCRTAAGSSGLQA